ncbi:MAG TPA: ferredoxin family protein [Bryobacteraceae bacterium]|nr:ferredoxin family protein [Bryobacteraceae bacterium]
MAYVITDGCNKDEKCVAACPVDCIHPKSNEPGFAEAPHLYVDPVACIDCGACVPVCEYNAVFALEDLPPEFASFTEVNAAHFV